MSVEQTPPASPAGRAVEGSDVAGRAARRRARNRERVLFVAEEAFRHSSYRDVRVEDLADAADVAVGTLYGYFGNKEGLYLTLVERAVIQFADYLKQAFSEQGSPLEQVMAAGEHYLRFHLEHPGSFQLLSGQAPVDGPSPLIVELRDRIGAQIEEIMAGFQDRIQAAIGAGEMAADLDARLAARFLWGAWNGVVALGLRGDLMRLTDDEIAACLRQGRRIVRSGLSVPDRGDS
ncbi:MAG: TetR/AcrR family transcriptional regulator [Nocardioidaceae bacterium]|nr:TetR/AcrR family transcriptional regulator [Nocardioidaceae bacterium]